MRRPRASTLLVFALCLAACSDGGERRDREERLVLDGPAADVGDEAPLADLVIPASAPTVVFLGDSIAAGLHLAEHQAFPSVLQRRCVEEGLPFELVCSCESGRTAAGGVTALDWVLRREPDIVVIELGGNDGLRGVELSAIENNLRAMIERSLARGAQVLLLGVRLPPNYGEYSRDFDAIYAELAGEYDVEFVPFWMQGVGAVPEMNLADGLHPTPEGHERLAENVLPTLREALERVR